MDNVDGKVHQFIPKSDDSEADTVQYDAVKAQIPSKEDTLDTAECCSEDSEADALGTKDVPTPDEVRQKTNKLSNKYRIVHLEWSSPKFLQYLKP